MRVGITAPRGPLLHGRREERSVLDRLLEDARAGHSAALMLRGEAGVGKTALLDYAIESASDFRVLRAVGVESEMELPFAALHQLCAPLLDQLDGLPDPQREAIEITFGLRAGEAPDRLFVGLAVLGLFSEVAQERPMLCVVDDAQWLDRASAQALAFVARRLLAESVVLLFGAREPGTEWQGLRELAIEGLPESDARQLLRAAIPWRLDEQVAGQLLAESRGNPLALLELPRGLSQSGLAGGFGLPAALSLSARIEESFRRRLESLPEDAQQLLLVAAAEPGGDPALLARAAETLKIPYRVFERAESVGLIEIDHRFRFRHPLVRSAVYQAATPQERRNAHWALAQATDANVDPDRRAWHLAEATARPDEDVAAELERAADRARSRGGLAAAAAFLERATTLTVAAPRRAERALAAARAKYEAGALDDALTLLATAETGELDDLSRAIADRLRAQIAFASRRGNDAPSLLVKAAQGLERIAPQLARATYRDALAAARFAGPSAGPMDLARVSRAALAGPPLPANPRPSDLLLQGLAVRYTQGYAAGAPILKTALSAFEREAGLPPEESRSLSLALWAAADLWDDGMWRLLTIREVEGARETGALTALPQALSMLSYIYANAGELDAAESCLDEISAAGGATSTPAPAYLALWIAALRGREAETRDLVRIVSDEAAARGEGYVVYVTEHATAVLNIGLGRYAAAVAALRRQAVDPFYGDQSPRPMAELVEAAVRVEETELAQRAFDALAETTTAAGTDWALGMEARSRALLTDREAAEALYREAIDRLGQTTIRVQLARAHLLYGEWLRRGRRRRDARHELRTAFEMFTSMGIGAFAGRAERELLATGERVRKRTVETREELTTQEYQISRLARDGLSNAEIGERMFISQHTVAYHLRKVFSKLDITSRAQLDAVLPDRV